MRHGLALSLIAGAAIATAGWTLHGDDGRARAGNGEPATTSELGPARVSIEVAATEPHLVNALFHGMTRAADRTVMSFTLGGRVVARPVRVGQRVGKGDLLARLDAKPLRNAKQAAQARLAEVRAQGEQLERDRRRAESLLAAGAATKAQVERASSGAEAIEAAESAAEVALTESKRQLAETTLRAPFDAQVIAVFAEADEVVGAGAPVVQLSGQAQHEIELAVPGRVAQGLAVGTEVPVIYADDETAMGGTVRQVSRASAGAGRLFSVLIAVDVTPQTPAGLSVRVELPVARHERVSVPLSALVDPSGARPRVFVESDGRASRRDVRIAGLVEDRVLVEHGLAPGDRVITTGLTHVLDGDAVEVLP